MKILEYLHQELIPLFVAEVIVLDLAGRALQIYKVRRIGANEIYLRITEQPLVCIDIRRITADNSVSAEVPDIARF